MKTYTKLILSLFVLVLIVAFLPTSALAATNTPVSHAISVVKQLDGDTPPSTEVFSFKLTAKDGAPMPSSDTVTISGNGTASFGAVQYTEPDDFVYTVSEAAGSTENYTYDTTVYTVIVQVTTDNAGNLSATQYVGKTDGKPADGKITFINTYTKPPVATPIPTPIPTSSTTGGGSSTTGSSSSTTTPPRTNDVTNDALLAKIIAVSGATMLVFVLYWNKRKKQADSNENRD